MHQNIKRTWRAIVCTFCVVRFAIGVVAAVFNFKILNFVYLAVVLKSVRTSFHRLSSLTSNLLVLRIFMDKDLRLPYPTKHDVFCRVEVGGM